MDKYEIAQIFREIARFLDFQEENPFRSIAYNKAAKAIENAENFEELLAKGELTTLPGIGKEISKMIVILSHDQPLNYLEELKAQIPESVFELLTVPKLGKRRAKFLYHELGIKSLDEFEQALKKGDIPRFRKETVSKLLKTIHKLKVKGRGVLWQEGLKIAQSLRNKFPSVAAEIVGELRRKLEIIFHIEIIALDSDPNILEVFSRHSFVKNIITKKPRKVRVLLKEGIIADLSLVKKNNWPYALVLHTGSKKHLKELKKEAENQGISFCQTSFKEFKQEEDIYKKLKMKYILPELREGDGEIQAAKKNRLPKLIEEKDIRGVFHCHTIDSDGTTSLEEMANGAKEMGWEYIGISDHSKSSVQANGLSEDKLFLQVERIKSFNKKNSSFRIFSGIECDILRSGELDFSDDVLKYLDYVIVSVHSLFRLNKKEMTKRIIKAVENPYMTMLGHISGRLLRHRDPYQIDIPKIIDACAANGKIIELNATPSRLDMDWRYWHLAKDKGVKCSINPDAHSLANFFNYRLGINCARKGWLEKNDVINTLPLKKIINFLKRN